MWCEKFVLNSYYLSFQQPRASIAKTSLTTGNIHCYPSFQPQRTSAIETLLLLKIFAIIYYSSHKGPQQQKSLFRWSSLLLFQPQKASVAETPLTVGAIRYYSCHRGPQQQKTLLPLEILTIPTTEGLNCKNPSCNWRSSLLSGAVFCAQPHVFRWKCGFAKPRFVLESSTRNSILSRIDQ